MATYHYMGLKRGFDTIQYKKPIESNTRQLAGKGSINWGMYSHLPIREQPRIYAAHADSLRVKGFNQLT